MSRDSYMDAMLRHLGAAYYESLHGRASAADVARARAAVEERLAENPATAGHLADGAVQVPEPLEVAHHHGRWHSTVRDVMTTKVVTVDRITPFKDIARLLTEHKISAVPVLTMGWHVAGVVSEDDLLAAQEQQARKGQAGKRSRPWIRGAGHLQMTAEGLMTSPPVTIHADAPIPRAARLMHSRHLKRLPVVDPGGKLLGIVSRRDLLSVFLRSDEQIADDIRELLSEILLADPASISVRVHEGVVTLTGQPTADDQRDLILVAIRLIWDIDGVVDVIERLDTPAMAAS